MVLALGWGLYGDRQVTAACYVPHRLLNEIFASRLMKPIWEAIGLLKGGPQLAKVGDDALRAVPKPWFSPSRFPLSALQAYLAMCSFCRWQV